AITDRIKKGKRPKAIIVVHLYGMPARMEEIISIAKKYEIPLIEDAAEALGSSILGKKCGTFGDMGILSFNGNKIITTSGGGALISKKAKDIKKATFLATQARDPSPHYQHSHIGYNYRMSNICAGIGRGQMEVLPERIEQRRLNYFFYEEELKNIQGISFLSEMEGFYSNRWLTTILVDPKKTGGITRENIRLELEKLNIESRPLWKPMHLQPVFKDCPYYGNNISETLFDDGLCLPSGSNLRQDELSIVSRKIKGLFKT
ncbi:MAG: DegT/DnrJ/EryC1/StrS family aminotransferase, partial [Ginsengibacter sp.]